MENKLTIEKMNEVVLKVQKMMDESYKRRYELLPYYVALTKNQRELKRLIEERYGPTAQVNFV